jgi:hypothetical protein
MKCPYPYIANFIWFQTIWFLAVGKGDSSYLFLLPLFAVHFLLCYQWKRELEVIASCALIGIIADSIFYKFGLYAFRNEPDILPIPFWLIAIWIGFAGTLRHSLRTFLNKPMLITALAGVFAPISYLAAMRLNAVTFPYGPYFTLICVSAAWIIMMTCFVKIVNFIETDLANTEERQK